MSRVRARAGLLGRLPTVVRTVRHLRPAQALAQVRHALVGLPAPVRLSEPAPALAISGVPVDFLPPPDHVRSPDGSRIELLARCLDLDRGIDWSSSPHGPLFAYHLHQHDYLRLDGFTPGARARWMLDWIDRHREGVGWDPHPISLRLLCWGKLLTTSGALEVDASGLERILSSMADQAETLREGLEVRLQANHLLSNRIALVAAGLLLDHPRSGRWLESVEGLLRELDAQIHSDGGHEERSPMYHALLLESLLDLANWTSAAPARAPKGLIEALRAVAGRMSSALEVWTHPDGRLAQFADSALGIASEPAALARYAERLGIGRAGAPGAADSRALPETGYARMRQGRTTLIASLAGPAPAHQPGHAHCDALSFELSFGTTRFVTDTGVYEYVPGAHRERARATGSHATIVLDGEEQAEIWSAHRIGGRPRVEWVAWNGTDRAEGRVEVWSRPGASHHRSFRVEPDAVTLVDRITGPCRTARLLLPLDPAWSVELLEDGPPPRALAVRRGGEGGALAPGEASGGSAPDPKARVPGIGSGGSDPSRVELVLFEGLEWRIVRAPAYPTFGCEVMRSVLVGEGPPFERSVIRILALDRP